MEEKSAFNVQRGNSELWIHIIGEMTECFEAYIFVMTFSSCDKNSVGNAVQIDKKTQPITRNFDGFQ